MDRNKPDGKDNHQEATEVVKQANDKGLGDISFRKNDRSPAPSNDGKTKCFLSELRVKRGKEQESGSSNKKNSFNMDTSMKSTASVDEFMDQDNSFRQLMNKINKPQFLKQEKGDSAKNFNFSEDFSTKSFPAHAVGATTKQDNSSFCFDDMGKSHYGPEPTMELPNDMNSWKDNQLESATTFGEFIVYNSNQRAKESSPYAGDSATVKSSATREHGQVPIRLESEGLINRTLSGILNEEKGMFENWGKILFKFEAAEMKLLERSSDALSEAERMREKYKEQKDKFQRKLSAISSVLTKNSK